MFTHKTKHVHRVPQHGPAGFKSGMVTRSDIHCGLTGCPLCTKVLLAAAESPTLLHTLPLLIPDADVVLQNINAMEDSRMENIVLLSTVMSAVQSRNRAIYMRLQNLFKDSMTKKCYAFANDRHEQTHCVPLKGEALHEFNNRCISVAAQWYARHMLKGFPNTGAVSHVIFVTHNRALRQRVEASEETAALPNFHSMDLREYVESFLSADSDLADRVQVMGSGLGDTTTSGASFPGGRCPVFEPHLPLEALESGLATGAFFRAKLRVSESSCFFGEIRGKFGGHAFDRIFLPGRFNLNRAIHDDVVVVKLLPVGEWRGRGRRGPSDSTNVNLAAIAEQPQSNPDEESAPITEEEALSRGFAPTGRVVGIEHMRRRPFCGSIDPDEVRLLQRNSAGAVSLLFRPKDGRIPRIRITTRHVDDLKNKRLSVVIDDWPIHTGFPLGHYVEVLGVIGDRDTEAKVILMENDIPHYDFSEAVYDCLPKGQWAVSGEEEARRMDLRDLDIVSIDPQGCRDIDDALHCRIVNQHHWEVGVHIADVTHFVPEQTAIDEEAAKRSTSVYLVDRRINMLPQLLTENLCSLVEGEDRYAFSVLWEFDENFNLVRDWFGKTIIRSRRAFYYGDAQHMIDDAQDQSEMAQSLRRLTTLARHFRSRREKEGALFLASQEFKYKVDMEHVNELDMQEYQTFEANSVVEEWMLYANVAVAKKIYQHFPHWTLLRRHERPAEGAFDALNEALMKKIQTRLDDSSSLALSRSLDACVDASDAYFNKLIRILATRCLCQAQYFSSGEAPKDEYYHFGLAMPMYTHFTSPIRRYADVIVHRQLAAAIGIGAVNTAVMTSDNIQALAENMNYRHEQAQRAGRDSQNLYTGFYLQGIEARGEALEEDAYMVRLSEAHVSVLVPRFGQESRILKESLLRVPELLDKVRVKIDVRGDNGVFGSKITCAIVGLMRCEDEDAARGDSEFAKLDDSASMEPSSKRVRTK